MKEIEKLFEDINVVRYPLTDDDNYDAVENFMYKLLSSKLEGVDDLVLKPYLSYSGEKRSLCVYGKMRFCVYRNLINKNKPNRTAEQTFNLVLQQIIAINKENGPVVIYNVVQPEDTPGISFNGVYSDDNTIYVEAHFSVAEGGKIL